jgi:mannitol/fructose-specific phosphotransferase system IIA component (Ntr-type)
MADSWEAASKSASKILGDKGKIPKYSAAVPKAAAAEGKAFDDFKKSREDLKSKLLALQNADEAHKNAISQFQDTIDEEDFGLDRKNKDEAKKIAEAQKILSGWLQEQIDVGVENVKNLKELDKHLMSLSNYKR